MPEATHYIVEVSRWRIVASATDEDEAYTKRAELQESADEWNYDNPHREPRYYQVVTVSEYYHGY
jgi:hypothetical protein